MPYPREIKKIPKYTEDAKKIDWRKYGGKVMTPVKDKDYGCFTRRWVEGKRNSKSVDFFLPQGKKHHGFPPMDSSTQD